MEEKNCVVFTKTEALPWNWQLRHTKKLSEKKWILLRKR